MTATALDVLDPWPARETKSDLPDNPPMPALIREEHTR